MLCQGRNPSRDHRLYEVKQDGYRALAVRDGNNVALISRNGKPPPLPEVKESVSRVRVKSTVVDCEFVALDPEGPRANAAL